MGGMGWIYKAKDLSGFGLERVQGLRRRLRLRV